MSKPSRLSVSLAILARTWGARLPLCVLLTQRAKLSFKEVASRKLARKSKGGWCPEAAARSLVLSLHLSHAFEEGTVQGCHVNFLGAPLCKRSVLEGKGLRRGGGGWILKQPFPGGRPPGNSSVPGRHGQG